MGVYRFEVDFNVLEAFEDIRRGVWEVVQRDLAELPAFRSWQLFCRKELRSIVAANADNRD